MTEIELAAMLGGRLYLVGGAVRDHLLKRTPKDKDYVLTGVKLKDVQLPKIAGKDFPVFLTEVDGKVVEIAMARKEKKTGQGYHGFEFYTDPSVTIEQDLLRRDLTINAMAIDVLTGELIDPFGGRADLRAGILRHTSEAFAEDPLRVYRVARFAAQLGFRVATETRMLMLKLSPELVTLTPERVFVELSKALTGRFPDKFFRELDGLLDVHFPEIEAIKVPDKHDGTAFEHTMAAIYRGNGLRERFALLVHDLGKGLSENPPAHHGHEDHEHLVQDLGKRLKIPKALVAFGRKTMRTHMKVKKLHEMRPGKLIRLIDQGLLRHMRLSYLESDGRYDRKLYLAHVQLAKRVIKLKKEVTGKVLIDRGVQPDAMFGEKLLQERIIVFKKNEKKLSKQEENNGRE
jgi:tRNA nucleotidyltransferase (CCA-adding enzyme)